MRQPIMYSTHKRAYGIVFLYVQGTLARNAHHRDMRSAFPRLASHQPETNFFNIALTNIVCSSSGRYSGVLTGPT